MTNVQYFTFKFNSSRLKEFNYNIKLTFKEAKKFNEIISLFDNQILRSIRDIKKISCEDKLRTLYIEKEKIKKVGKKEPPAK